VALLGKWCWKENEELMHKVMV